GPGARAGREGGEVVAGVDPDHPPPEQLRTAHLLVAASGEVTEREGCGDGLDGDHRDDDFLGRLAHGTSLGRAGDGPCVSNSPWSGTNPVRRRMAPRARG